MGFNPRTARPFGGALDPAHEALVSGRLQHTLAAGHQEGVDRSADTARRSVRHDREAAPRLQRARLRRHDLNAVLGSGAQAGRGREDLEWAGHVEGLGAVEGEDGDASHGLEVDDGGCTGWQQ